MLGSYGKTKGILLPHNYLKFPLGIVHKSRDGGGGRSEFLEKTSRKRHAGWGDGSEIFKTHKEQFWHFWILSFAFSQWIYLHWLRISKQGNAKIETWRTKIFGYWVFVQDFVPKVKIVLLSFRFFFWWRLRFRSRLDLTFSFKILIAGFGSNFFDSDSSKIFDVVRDENVESKIET